MASHRDSHSHVSHSTHNGDSEPSETYHKVHHELDSAAAKRKPIVTESNYKVTTAEPGVENRPHVGDRHEHSKTKTNVTKSTHSSNQKGQFISKPDHDHDSRADSRADADDDDDDEGGLGTWAPLLGGAAAIAAVIGGLLYYKKRNPDADQRFRRSVEDADYRVKGAFGSGERRVKEFLGSGQQRFKGLVGRAGGSSDDSDEEDHSHNPLHGQGSLYKVKKGDNMAKIAQKTGKKSWHEIAEKNPSFRNPNLIYPGDELRV